jgi:DNA-binding transcriptional MerR regulator
MTTKAEGAFRTISEVSQMLDVPAHVLRFWETKFTSLTPLKRNGGRRYYRPDDVELLVRVRDLLYREGYTIKGVQKLLSSIAGADISTLEDGNSGTAAMAQLHQALQVLLETRADIGRMKDALGA